MRRTVQTMLVVFLVLFTAFCLVKCFAATESVTIQTYYPAPFGVYRDVNVTGSILMSNISGDGTWQRSLVFTNLSNATDNSSIKLVSRMNTPGDPARSELRIEVWNSLEDRVYIGGAKGFGNLAEGAAYPPGGLMVTGVGNAVLSGEMF